MPVKKNHRNSSGHTIFAFRSTYMSIVRKVRRVERLFNELEKQTNELKKASGIHCLLGCGTCCTKPDIEASVLEFLPLAFDFYLNKKAEILHEELGNADNKICTVFHQIGKDSGTGMVHGSCSKYDYRGLICRLFSFAATRDKNGNPQLAACRFIKQQEPDQYQLAMQYIVNGKNVPFFSDYYQKLMQIDFRLGQEYLPINQAIRRALEEVLNYYQYRPFPKRHIRVA